MSFKNFDFQNNALNKLYDAFVSDKKNVIFQSPTGSGKTAVLITLMDRMIENGEDNIAFIWLTPGAGELEEQSWEKTSKHALYVKPQFLNEALNTGFQPSSVTFLNWEIVNRKGNLALKDGERINLPQSILLAKEKQTKFVLIIDEEHRNQTDKSRSVIELFDAISIFRASATPIDDPSAFKVIVQEEDVIAAGMITRNVIINDQFIGAGDENELKADDQEYLDVADQKRNIIRAEYDKLNISINPLVLIQFPDDKSSDSEIESKIESVKEYLIKELGHQPEKIGVWMSNVHDNVEDIEHNNSPVNYLLMKQAVSTGWDAPRAKILVKLRLNTSKRFTIQTIGRIRRMPEQKHYGNEILDNSYVYSNDENYVYEVIKNQMGSALTQMGLKKEVPRDMYNLISFKRKETTNNDLNYVVQSMRKEFVKEFKLTNNVDNNKKKLESFGFVFGTTIYSDIPHGKIRRLEDLVDLDTVKVSFPVIDTRKWGYRYDAVMKSLQPYLHVGHDLRNIRAIIADLFAYGEPGSDIKSLLKLKPKERYAFIINNARRIRDAVKKMDSRHAFAIQQNMYNYDPLKKYHHTPLILKAREGYLDNGAIGNILSKNVYDGYSVSNWFQLSNPEKMFEEAIEKNSKIEWIYRSKDKGENYFSVPYNGDTKDFYPDYLLKSYDGITYIIEIKGPEGQNIDDYSESKFNALKNYVEGLERDDVKFAFVRPSNRYKNVLMYNNEQWDEKVDESSYWSPMTELF